MTIIVVSMVTLKLDVNVLESQDDKLPDKLGGFVKLPAQMGANAARSSA
jgi:hypothetical protein